ncbi:response regulator [Palleronia pelagia]|uniref:Response regulatory domain-containing protein n=1 Tax=Palleronia pelagia TaxID=387096 RepID=A0A1H8ET97_9RHOB|nr:hypothetical protein [Palleronia pelagia]SEN22107.1 hypothetical protein SAMN04488011_10373 [Palleronia pelagia]
MPIVLIVENVPVVSEDIAETVRTQLPDAETMTATSLKDAEDIVVTGTDIRLCIVSGSAAAPRLEGLARALAERQVPTVVMTNHQVVVDMFDERAEILGKPFSTQMLSDALRNLNLSD